jgi:hypothetical protein
MGYSRNWRIIMKEDDLTPKQWEEIYKLEDNILDCVCDFDLDQLSKDFDKDKQVANSLKKFLKELKGYQKSLLSYHERLEEISANRNAIKLIKGEATKKKNLTKKTKKK